MVVNVLDLPKGSSLKIKYICDKCGQIFKTSYCKYNNNESFKPLFINT